MKHKVLLIGTGIWPVGNEMLESCCDVIYAPDGREETLIRLINEHGIEGMIARSEKITRELFESCPSLKVISSHGVGLDHIDVEAATECGVRVLNVPDGNYIGVCEHAIMFILACAKQLINNDSGVRVGNWKVANTYAPHDIKDKTLLLIGLGRIGRGVAERAQAFGMRLTGYDAYMSGEQMARFGVTKVDSLEQGLAQADFVTIHLPLTPETTGLIGEKQLKAMKSTAFLCNMGRGAMVDEKALYRALAAHEIGGAALDVFDPEPPLAGDPLFALDNVIVTPHAAGDTYESRQCVSTRAAENLIKALDGEATYNWFNRQAMESVDK